MSLEIDQQGLNESSDDGANESQHAACDCEVADITAETVSAARAVLMQGLRDTCEIKQEDSGFPPAVKEKILALKKRLEAEKGFDAENFDLGSFLKEIVDGFSDYATHLSKNHHVSMELDIAAVYNSFMLSQMQFDIIEAGADKGKFEKIILSKRVSSILTYISSKEPGKVDIVIDTLRSLGRFFIRDIKHLATLDNFPLLKTLAADCFSREFFKGIKEEIKDKGALLTVVAFCIRLLLLGCVGLHDLAKHILSRIGFLMRVLFTYPVFAVKGALRRKKNAEFNKSNRQRWMKMIEYLGQKYEEASVGQGEPARIFDYGDFAGFFIVTKKYNFPLPEMGNPEQALDKLKPNVLIVSSSEDDFALAEELNRQAEVNVIIGGNDGHYGIKKGGKKVIALKGGVFQNGRLILGDFEKPVECDYIVSRYWGDDDGIMTKGGCVPMACMKSISAYTENKQVAKAFLDRDGITTAPSVFWIHKVSDFLQKMANKGIVKCDIFLRQDIEEFFKKYGCESIVIKPVQGECGRGVKFFNADEIDKAEIEVRQMLAEKQDVIMEQYMQPAPLCLEQDGEQKAWNLRVFVSRDSDNKLKASDMVVRYDDYGKPVNLSLGARAARFETVAQCLNLPADQAQDLRRRIEDMSVRAFQCIENAIHEFEKVAPGNQQDFMGIDIIVRREGDRYVPYVIEVNDHHSGGMWDLDNVSGRDQKGSACKDFAATIARRAKKHFEGRC